MRMQTVLNPSFKSTNLFGKRVAPTFRDYILVPTIATYGTWLVRDLITPEELAMLATFANSLEKRPRR